MSSAYTKITFDDSAHGITAKKLNLLTDDLSAAIAAGGGGTGTGDMTKAVYDTNSNNVVDTCDSLAWAKLTGIPSTFPPDSSAMLKSVYDTNADNIVDHAALADAAPWSGISGKPATFPPDSTAMLKSVYDINNDGISDHAALADSAPWTGITGAPAVPAPSSTTPAMDGTAAVGAGTTYARADHVHPSDTSRVAATRQILTSQSVTGGGDLSADRTLTLVGDSATPGNSMFYGTNASGVRGWLAQPTGTVNPGTWTNLSYGTGWTQNTTAQYRVETNGSFQKVICQGIINYASGAASLAFTLPAGARPGVTRGCVVSGVDSSGDTLLYSVGVVTSGAVTIVPMVRTAFSWPSATNGSVYLDGLSFAL